MIDCTSPGNWISPSHLTDHFLPTTGTIPLTELVWPKGVSGGVDWCLSTSLSSCVSSVMAEPSHSGEETQASQRVLGSVLASQAQEWGRWLTESVWRNTGSERKGSQRMGRSLEMPPPSQRRLYEIFIHRKTKRREVLIDLTVSPPGWMELSIGSGVCLLPFPLFRSQYEWKEVGWPCSLK